MQVRLLRVLESGRFCRVGGDQEISASVRVVAASNRDLGKAVAEGRLREDLMYRLCVIPLPVPPLRDRGGDALLLAEMFLAELNAEHGTKKTYTGPSARARCGVFVAWQCSRAEERGSSRAMSCRTSWSTSMFRTPARQRLRRRNPWAPWRCPESHPSISAIAARVSAHSDAARDVTIRVGTSLDDAERALIMATLDSVSGSKAKGGAGARHQPEDALQPSARVSRQRV